jgi:hypothetical protein
MRPAFPGCLAVATGCNDCGKFHPIALKHFRINAMALGHFNLAFDHGGVGVQGVRRQVG